MTPLPKKIKNSYLFCFLKCVLIHFRHGAAHCGKIPYPEKFLLRDPILARSFRKIRNCWLSDTVSSQRS
jgi:hypothetical protein